MNHNLSNCISISIKIGQTTVEIMTNKFWCAFLCLTVYKYLTAVFDFCLIKQVAGIIIMLEVNSKNYWNKTFKQKNRCFLFCSPINVIKITNINTKLSNDLMAD